jgi:hypothetical protein
LRLPHRGHAISSRLLARPCLNRLARRLDRLECWILSQVFAGKASTPARRAGKRYCQLARRSRMLVGLRRSLASHCVGFAPLRGRHRADCARWGGVRGEAVLPGENLTHLSATQPVKPASRGPYNGGRNGTMPRSVDELSKKLVRFFPVWHIR